MNHFNQIHTEAHPKAEQNVYTGSHLLRPTKTCDAELPLPLLPDGEQHRARLAALATGSSADSLGALMVNGHPQWWW